MIETICPIVFDGQSARFDVLVRTLLEAKAGLSGPMDAVELPSIFKGEPPTIEQVARRRTGDYHFAFFRGHVRIRRRHGERWTGVHISYGDNEDDPVPTLDEAFEIVSKIAHAGWRHLRMGCTPKPGTLDAFRQDAAHVAAAIAAREGVAIRQLRLIHPSPFSRANLIPIPAIRDDHAVSPVVPDDVTDALFGHLPLMTATTNDLKSMGATNPGWSWNIQPCDHVVDTPTDAVTTMRLLASMPERLRSIIKV